MTKINIFCEGQTERAIVKALNLLGKVEIINLWETNLSSRIRRYPPKSSYFVIIFDTDAIDEKRLKRFNQNLAVLKKHQYPYVLMQQTENLEDELIYASKLKNIHALRVHFKAQGNSNLKAAITQITNLEDHLNDIDLDRKKLWSRGINLQIKHQSDPQKICADHLEMKPKS